MPYTPDERKRCRIVGTPIGNLSDLTPRAASALEEADIIFAEDTRTARELLSHLKLSKTIKSYHKDNERQAAAEVLKELESGKNIALISEAGMPGISDPGFVLVQEMLRLNLPFEVVPGVSAVTHAAVASGLVKGAYLFAGFLPHKEAEKTINALKNIPHPIVFYESVHRVKNTLRLLLEHFTPPVAVARELTKLYEEVFYVHSAEDIEQLTLKGEFCLVVDNSGHVAEESAELRIDAKKLTGLLKNAGLSTQGVVAILKESGLSRNQAYEMAKDIRED
jgi:16S rRNA (cytidine1402-2'-O)-methyltransferase